MVRDDPGQPSGSGPPAMRRVCGDPEAAAQLAEQPRFPHDPPHPLVVDAPAIALQVPGHPPVAVAGDVQDEVRNGVPQCHVSRLIRRGRQVRVVPGATDPNEPTPPDQRAFGRIVLGPGDHRVALRNRETSAWGTAFLPTRVPGSTAHQTAPAPQRGHRALLRGRPPAPGTRPHRAGHIPSARDAAPRRTTPIRDRVGSVAWPR